jgi:hypothetical protein
MEVSFYHIVSYFSSSFSRVKPFYLPYLPDDHAHLCSVHAIAEWVKASGISSGYLFCKLSSDRVLLDDIPMVTVFRFLLQLFIYCVIQTVQYFLEQF